MVDEYKNCVNALLGRICMVEIFLNRGEEEKAEKTLLNTENWFKENYTLKRR